MQFDYFLHVLGYGAPTNELTNKLKNLRASNNHMVYDGPPYGGNGGEPTTDVIIGFVGGTGLGRSLRAVVGAIKAYLQGDESRKIILEREGKRITITGEDKEETLELIRDLFLEALLKASKEEAVSPSNK